MYNLYIEVPSILDIIFLRSFLELMVPILLYLRKTLEIIFLASLGFGDTAPKNRALRNKFSELYFIYLYIIHISTFYL